MKKILAISFLLFLSLFQFSPLLSVQPALADSTLLSGQEGFQQDEVQAVFGNDTPDDLRVTIVRIVMIVLSFLGIIFVVLIIFAGFKYMTAAGNEDKVKDAIKQITNATIGLVIILAAWSISYYILTAIRNAVVGTNLLPL